MAQISLATPTQEGVLKLIEDHGGTIGDTRKIYPGSNEQDSFQQRAAWQQSLQGVLNSLTSREVS